MVCMTDNKLIIYVSVVALRRADNSSRGDLANVVCLSVIVKPRQ